MQCFILLILLFLPVVRSVVTLTTQHNASVSVPINVTWTREDGDPAVFDLRIVHRGHDLGLVAASIDATVGRELSGIANVTFDTPGRFVLVAVDFNNDNKDISTSNVIFVTLVPAPSSSEFSSLLSGATESSVRSSATIPTFTVSTTTTIPSSTDSSSASAIAGSTMTPSNASLISRVNTTAIVGGVLGGIILILVLVILLIFVKRKGTRKRKRLTFEPDLMVQDAHRPTVTSDIEEGSGTATSPVLPPLSFQLPLTAPNPQGRTRSQFRASVLNTPVPTYPPTHRQVQLGTRIVQLENQISSIRKQNRGQEGMELVLEHMTKQVEWLRAERDSPWARCETDVPHPLLERYMH